MVEDIFLQFITILLLPSLGVIMFRYVTIAVARRLHTKKSVTSRGGGLAASAALACAAVLPGLGLVRRTVPRTFSHWTRSLKNKILWFSPSLGIVIKFR